MSKPLPQRSRSKQKEALEHSFVSALETITDLSEEKVRSLAKKFRDRTASEIERQRHKAPDITFYPRNQAHLEFEIRKGCVTRSPSEILEHYLDRHNIGGEWKITSRKEKGSLVKISATRGHALSEREVSEGGSSDSSKSEAEELKEQLDGLSDEKKKAIKDVLS